MKGTVMYDEPRVIHLRSKAYAPNVLMSVAHGETNRSWLCGESQNPASFRCSKSEYELISEQEYEDQQWASRNGYKISRKIYDYGPGVTPETLRKIAELIGYEEGK